MTYDSTKPADNELVSNVPSVIRANFDVINTAWNGDHQDISDGDDGSTSTKHDKVTLVAQAAATAISGSGIVYVDSASNNDLFYKYPTGGTYSSCQLTSAGHLYGAPAAYCVFDGTSATGTITPSHKFNIHATNLVNKTATGTYVIYFNTAMATTTYGVIIQTSGTSGTLGTNVVTLRETDKVTIQTQRATLSVAASANRDFDMVTVVVYE